MRTPRIRGRFDPVDLDGETVWVSADRAWVVVPRPHLERFVGHVVGPAPRTTGETDFGVVMGTGAGGERPGTLSLEMVPNTSLRPATLEAMDLEPLDGSLDDATPLAAPVPAPAGSARDEVAPGTSEQLRIVSLLALAGALFVLGIAITLALFLRSTRPVPAEEDELGLTAVTDRAAAVMVAPTPNVPAPEPPPWAGDLAQGEELLASDPVRAMAHFRRVLAMQPRHAVALAGLGRAELAIGAGADALEHLCEARRMDRTVATEVDAALATNGLSCDSPQ